MAPKRIHGKFDTQPLVEASIRRTISNTYRDLGFYPEAQRQLELALGLRSRVLGEEHPDTLIMMHNLADLYWYQGKYPEEPLLVKTLEVNRRKLGEEHPDTLIQMSNLAVVASQRSVKRFWAEHDGNGNSERLPHLTQFARTHGNSVRSVRAEM